MAKELRFNIAKIPSSYVLDTDNPTLVESIAANISEPLRYGCTSWSGHLSATVSESCDRHLEAINDFLKLRVLFWMETMNLLHRHTYCEAMLQACRQQIWTSPSNPKPGLVSDLLVDLHDAEAFALYFSSSGARLSTPHLYISCLQTFARPSRLADKWRTNFAQLPKFTPARGYNEGALLSEWSFERGITIAAPSFDGSKVALASNSIQMLDRTTSKMVQIDSETYNVHSIALSPDGLYIAYASQDGWTRVRTTKGEEDPKFSAVVEDRGRDVSSYREGCPVEAVLWSPDGKYLLTGGNHNSVRFWNASNGQHFKDLTGHTRTVMALAYTPNSCFVISSSLDRTARIWSVILDWGLELASVYDKGGYITCISCSPDSRRAVCGSSSGTAVIFAIPTGKVIHELEGHEGQISSVGYSPDGTSVATGSHDSSIRIWEPLSGQQLKVFVAHGSWVNAIMWTPDTRRIISASFDSSMRVWDVTRSASHLEHRAEGHVGAISAVAWSPNGKYIASCSLDCSIRTFDAQTGQQLRVFRGHTSAVLSINYAPDGASLASGAGDATVRVWDTANGQLRKAFTGHRSDVLVVAFSPNGGSIVSGSTDASIRIWDSTTGEQLNGFEHSDLGAQVYISAIAWSPDGARILAGTNGGLVYVVDCKSGQRRRVHEDQRRITSVAWSPDGTQIVAATWVNDVFIWDASSGELTHLFERHGLEPASWPVAFSPDSKQILTGARNNTIRVLDLLTGTEFCLFQGHVKSVSSVAFSPDGAYIASGSSDRSVRVWSLAHKTSVSRYIRETTHQGQHTG